MKLSWLIVGGVALFVFFICGTLYQTTGFLQMEYVDFLDEQNWLLSDGTIPGSEGFELQGTSETCWILVHGYTSTPDELRELATVLHTTFNDTIYVPRLYGHGERPSHVERFSVEDWYAQVEQLAEEKHCAYMFGSSMGGSIVLRYAETHDVEGVVLQGILLKPQPDYLPMTLTTEILTPFVRYLKKVEPGGTVMRPEGKKEHLSYWTFPLKGAVELNNFNKVVVGDLRSVDDRVLFVHAVDDSVASYRAARGAYDSITSEKYFVDLDQGDHIVLRDYDKQDAIDAVVGVRAD